MSRRQDIAFHLGSTWEIECEVRNADGDLIEISAAEWRLADQSTNMVKATIGDGITVTGPGRCVVRVTPTMQAAVVAGNHVHELWVREAVTLVESVQVVGSANIVRSLKKKFP